MTDASERRILVVEDDWLVSNEIEAELSKAGFQVAGPVASLQPALKLVSEQAIHGAVLDVALKGGSSLPIARALDERGIPYVFISGYVKSTLPAEFRERPLLKKPFRWEALTAELGNLLAVRPPSDKKKAAPFLAGRPKFLLSR